jgi:hypothetical protein
MDSSFLVSPKQLVWLLRRSCSGLPIEPARIAGTVRAHDFNPVGADFDGC